MKNITLLFIIIFTITSCSPGELIDKKKSDSYFKKKDGIYYCPHGNWFELGINKCDTIIGSFIILSQNIAKDSRHIFYKDKIQKHIDYNSFFIDNINGYSIPKDKNNVYRGGWSNNLKSISNEDIDSKSYQYLENNWAKDKNHYYRYDKTLNVDYKSFEILNNNYSKDKDSVYFMIQREKQISIAEYKHDVTTIDNINIIIDNILYKRNIKSNLVFNKKTKIRSIVPNVFQINNQIVFDTIILENLNGKADYFKPLFDRRKPTFYTDSSNVYYENLIIKQCDINSFKLTNYYRSHYSYDKENVYYKNLIIKHFNRSKLVVMSERIIKDNQSVYLDGKLVKELNAENFKEKTNKPRIWTDGIFDYNEDLMKIKKQ